MMATTSTCVHDEAMLKVIADGGAAKINPVDLALHVIGRLALDVEDLRQVRQLTDCTWTLAHNPEIIANWRRIRGQEQQ
jgi:hypothetical protein